MKSPAVERFGPNVAIEDSVPDPWREHLVEFESKVWPVFQAAGYSKDTALIVWHVNLAKNEIRDVWYALVEQEDDDAGPWQP